MDLDRLRLHRRTLHRIPEIMYDLPKTQAYVLSVLKKLSCRLEIVAQSGVLAFFDSGKDSSVAFRSDMDALPVTENTTHDYPSTHPGAMHACGHDGHMALLLTFAEWLNDHYRTLSHNVLLIFQPAEECGGGGGVVVESGCLTRYNVKRAFAIHVDPDLPIGTVASRPGPFFAQTNQVHMDIQGAAGHAAVPGAGKDALAAAAEFVHDFYLAEPAVPRKYPSRLRFCQLRSGECTNIIADKAHVQATMRTYCREDRDALMDCLRAAGAAAEEKYGVKCVLSIDEGYPPLHNDAALYERCRAVYPIKELPEPIFLGEDFAYYAMEIPGVLFKIGLGTGIALHSAEFDFDEAALETGLDLYIHLVHMEDE